VLTIDSGDRVTVESLSGGPMNLPPVGFTVPPELLRIHRESQRKAPGHILTGPIAVRGAEPGDVYSAVNPQPWLNKLGLKP
jgi:acetamidase/formamidase